MLKEMPRSVKNLPLCQWIDFIDAGRDAQAPFFDRVRGYIRNEWASLPIS